MSLQVCFDFLNMTFAYKEANQKKSQIRTNSSTQSCVNTLAVGLETFTSLSALGNHPVMQKVRR